MSAPTLKVNDTSERFEILGAATSPSTEPSVPLKIKTFPTLLEPAKSVTVPVPVALEVTEKTSEVSKEPSEANSRVALIVTFPPSSVLS